MKFELYYPLKNILITQHFGNPNPLYNGLGIKGHNGMDFLASDGEPVYASHDGEVTFAGEDGAGGLTVVIRTLQEYDYNGGKSYYKTIYCHLKKGSFLVHAGSQVKTGDQIASADNTGMSTGSHLHFGLKPVFPGEQSWQWYNLESDNGYNGAIDPEPFLNGKYAREQIEKYKFTNDFGVGTWRIIDTLKLQQRLIQEGVATFSTPTGFFGGLTQLAVKRYQEKNGILATGYVGPLTRAKLNT